MPTKRVLVLHSYHQGYSWTDNITFGIQQEFQNLEHTVELFVEYMDTKRLSTEAVFPVLVPLYRLKYANVQFDAIICCDDNALDFLSQFHDQIFNDVPIIYCGINDDEAPELQDLDHFFGVLEQHDIRASFDLALSFDPRTTNIAVVSDNTTTGQLMMQQLLAVIPEYAHRINFTLLNALPPDELAAAVRQLPYDSLVLLLTYLRDRDGTSYPTGKGPQIIRDNSNLPIFTLWEDFVTEGVTGGLVISGREQGASAARMVTQIIHGTKIVDLSGPHPRPAEYLFDFRELKRLGISKQKLPIGSRIINEPQTFYYRYRYGVWTVLVVFTWLFFSVVILVRNSHRRKIAEHALQVEKEFMATVLDAIAVPLYYRDTHGVYLGTNYAGIEFFGFADDKNDLIGKTSYDLFSKEVADKAAEADQQLIRSGGTQSYESVMINAEGQPRNVIFHKALFYDVDGSIAGIVGTMLDITDLKNAQQLASRFGRILDSSLEEIYIIDAQTYSVVRTTLGARQKLGYSDNEISQLSILEILPEITADLWNAKLSQLQDNEQKTLVFTTQHQCKDGSQYPVELHLQQTDLAGEDVYVVMALDITERVNLERLKNEMLSMVSHEMRTPLTGMLGFTEFLLENDPAPAQRRDCLKTVYSETLKLGELIDNLLNLQQFRAKQYSHRLQAVAVYPLLDEVAHLFSRASENHHIDLQCDMAIDDLRGDRAHLLQVLKNLLSNAIKYSPKGGTVVLGAVRDQDNIRIWVADEGMGISEHDQKMIFEHFYRVDNSDCRSIGGTGLGLALVKEMVETQGGQMGIESTLGVGSTFYFSLPVAKVDAD